MKLFKMHRIIKPTCPRQLFINITFAFMKIFDFIVKIAIFGVFLFWSRDSRHALLPKPMLDRGSKAWCESLDRKRNAPKMVIFTRKSKILIKAKAIFMKSCLEGYDGFMIRCILTNFIFSNVICKKVYCWILIFFLPDYIGLFLDYKNQ